VVCNTWKMLTYRTPPRWGGSEWKRQIGGARVILELGLEPDFPGGEGKGGDLKSFADEPQKGLRAVFGTRNAGPKAKES